MSTQVDVLDGSLAPRETSLDRLAAGVRDLRIGRGKVGVSEHTLMLIGGVIAPLGLVLVLIGWWGAAHTPNLFEQVPYLISGGLFGLSLVILGGFLYFAHWITELIKETRAQANVLATALERLEEVVATAATAPSAASAPAVVAPPASVPAPSPAGRRTLVAPAPALVATAKGTMAHRPDCVVVAGKEGVRAVDAGDGLLACKLCDSGAAE